MNISKQFPCWNSIFLFIYTAFQKWLSSCWIMCFSLSLVRSFPIMLVIHNILHWSTVQNAHSRYLTISLKRDEWRGKGKRENRGTNPGSTVTMCWTWVITSPFSPRFLFAFSFPRAKLHRETWGTLQHTVLGAQGITILAPSMYATMPFAATLRICEEGEYN